MSRRTDEVSHSYNPVYLLAFIDSTAPVPRKKEGRAARLAAMLEGEGNGEETPTPDITTPIPDADSIGLPASTETLKEEPQPLADRTNV